MNHKYIIPPKLDVKIPVIVFTENAYYKIFAACQSKETKGNEIAWIGSVTKTEKEKNIIYLVDDVFFFPQKNSSATVEDDEEKYAQWFHEKFPTMPLKKSVRLHGHLHPNFATNPSATDQTLFKQLLDRVDDFFLRMIVNKNYNYNFDIFDKEQNLIWENVEFNVLIDEKILLQVNSKGIVKLPNLNLKTIENTIIDNKFVFNISDSTVLEIDIDKMVKKFKTTLLEVSNDNVLKIQFTSDAIDKELTSVMSTKIFYTTYNKPIHSVSKYGYEYEDDSDYNGRYMGFVKPPETVKPLETKSLKESLIEKYSRRNIMDDLEDALATYPADLTTEQIKLMTDAGVAIPEDFEAANYYDVPIGDLTTKLTKSYNALKNQGTL